MTTPFEKLTFREMVLDSKYWTLSDGLVKLPVPDKIKIGKKYYNIPESMADIANQICYGQRLFLTEKEKDDFGIILRFADGYFYPIVTGKKWDDFEALKFGSEILNCLVSEIYPAANRIIQLFGELIEREQKLLIRKPKSEEIAAGIDLLAKYSELSAVKFLQTSFGVSRNEVYQLPYNDCLVEFMLAKEQDNYVDRLTEVYKMKEK